jgi:hypothetical protein
LKVASTTAEGSDTVDAMAWVVHLLPSNQRIER